jgi:predicted Fe-Mo cluster-binding NifX family protein
MIICITAQGPDPDSEFEPHFARAPFFLFYETGTGMFEPVKNGFTVRDQRIGQNAVRLLQFHGSTEVITGEIGENAQQLLADAGIDLHIWKEGGSARQALTAALAAPDTVDSPYKKRARSRAQEL